MKIEKVLQSLDYFNEAEPEQKPGLAHYSSGEYKDYKHGNPHEAAKELQGHLSDIEAIFSKFGGSLNKAGEFLSPGVKNALKHDLEKLIKTYLK